MNQTRKTLIAVFLTVFIDLLGFGLIVPILPSLFFDNTSPNFLLSQDSNQYTKLIFYGLLLGTFPLAQFFATPIFGQLSDHYGRRRILLLSLLGDLVAYFILVLGILFRSLFLIFLARAIGGLTGGNVAVAQAVVGDVSTPKNSAKNFGLIGGAFGLGFVLGPFFGGRLAAWGGSTAPFWILILVCICNILFVYFNLPETYKKELDGKFEKIDWNKSIEEIFLAFKLKSFRIILLMSFLYQAGFTFLTTFANPFFIERFGWKEEQIGNFFGYIGIWLVITQALIIRFTLKFDQRKLLTWSLLLCSIFTGFLLLPRQEFWLYWIAPLFAIFVGIVNANITSLVSNLSSAEKQGEAIGVNSSVQALAQAIPPLISGFISFGMVSLPIWISVIVMFSSWLVFARFYRA
jgi:MFS transporter, DHA1 family, tetracycline resistance protein